MDNAYKINVVATETAGDKLSGMTAEMTITVDER